MSCMPSKIFKKNKDSDKSISNKIENNIRPTASDTPHYNDRDVFLLNARLNATQFVIDENVINEKKNDSGLKIKIYILIQRKQVNPLINVNYFFFFFKLCHCIKKQSGTQLMKLRYTQMKV
jgi:hypothetical protein